MTGRLRERTDDDDDDKNDGEIDNDENACKKYKIITVTYICCRDFQRAKATVVHFSFEDCSEILQLPNEENNERTHQYVQEKVVFVCRCF